MIEFVRLLVLLMLLMLLVATALRRRVVSQLWGRLGPDSLVMATLIIRAHAALL